MSCKDSAFFFKSCIYSPYQTKSHNLSTFFNKKWAKESARQCFYHIFKVNNYKIIFWFIKGNSFLTAVPLFEIMEAAQRRSMDQNLGKNVKYPLLPVFVIALMSQVSQFLKNISPKMGLKLCSLIYKSIFA